MPKVRTLRTKRPPEGFDDIEPVLLELQEKMREAVNASHEGKRKNEAQWPIFRISHQQSRYVFELFYRKKKISRELYEWLCDEGYCDNALISKWRKPGFERLCCIKCIQTTDTNHGGVCICRVPRNELHQKGLVECQACGCRGCASGDSSAKQIIGGKKKKNDGKDEEAKDEDDDLAGGLFDTIPVDDDDDDF